MIQTINDKIATYAENMILKISKYNQNDLEVIFQINTAYRLYYMKSCFHDHLIIVFQTGKIDFLKVEGDKVFSLNFTCSDEHDKPISALAYSSKYIVTGGVDCRIKVWTYDKQLVKNINFNDPVRGIEFISDSDEVVISHAQSLTKLNLNVPNFYREAPEREEVTPDYYQQVEVNLTVAQISDQASSILYEDTDFAYRSKDKRESIFRPPRASAEGFSIDEDVWNEFMKRTDNLISPIRDFSIVESSRLSITKKRLGSLKVRKTKRRNSKESKHHKRYLKSLKKPPSPLSNFIQEEYRHLISTTNERLPIPKKLPQPAFITRRMLTQEKIIANIKRFGEPCDYLDASGLHVMEDPSLPPIHTNY